MKLKSKPVFHRPFTHTYTYETKVSLCNEGLNQILHTGSSMQDEEAGRRLGINDFTTLLNTRYTHNEICNLNVTSVRLLFAQIPQI